jgi:hypothetical protein
MTKKVLSGCVDPANLQNEEDPFSRQTVDFSIFFTKPMEPIAVSSSKRYNNKTRQRLRRERE